MFNTIQEIKRANKSINHHFFDADTMSFFNSKVVNKVWHGRYFITSEQYNATSPRLYTIRYSTDQGRIETLGIFQQYKTLRQAEKAIADIPMLDLLARETKCMNIDSKR